MPTIVRKGVFYVAAAGAEDFERDTVRISESVELLPHLLARLPVLRRDLRNVTRLAVRRTAPRVVERARLPQLRLGLETLPAPLPSAR